MDFTLVLVYGGFTVGISFCCSLLEAALLSARRGSLTEKARAGSRGAAELLEIKETRLDDAISGILTLNTVSNTAGAGLATQQAAVVWQSVHISVFAGILTFAVLVFSEIIPKTIGAAYATSLSPLVGRLLTILLAIMTPFIFFTRVLTRLISRGTVRPISRGELSAILETAAHQGTLQGDESQVFANLLTLEQIRVQDVMTPRTVVTMIPADSTVGDLLSNKEASVFSRIPLYQDNRDNVIGYVVQREVLRALATGVQRKTPVSHYMRSIWFIPELASMVDALRQFQEHPEPLAMVVDEHDGLSGLLTLEDLLETLLGAEIMDESDKVADLRVLAAHWRDSRIDRIKRSRRFLPDLAADADNDHGDESTLP